MFRNEKTRPARDLREMLRESAARRPTATAFREKKDGIYQDISFARFRTEVDALGTALVGKFPRDARVLLLGGGYRFALCYLALICGAGVPVPADSALSAEKLGEIVVRVGITAVLYDDAEREKVNALGVPVAVPFSELSALVASGKTALAAGDTAYTEREIDRDALAAVFFTAGVTGKAKDVTLSHANICRTLSDVAEMTAIGEEDTFLSVLPLSHAYECVCGLLAPLSLGAAVAFSEGLGALTRNLRETHATAMVCVPFLAEAIYRRLWQNVEKRGTETRVRRAISVSDPVRPLSARQALKEKLLAEERAFLGGRLNRMIVLGAPIDAAVQKGLRQFGIFAVQGYGITECAGLAALNSDEHYRDGSAGIALPSGVLDIYNPQPDGSGEIRVKGENVMLGYLNAPELTEAALNGGWFYTGDIGRIDEDGYLHVIGRRRNAIGTADGKLICPEEIEALLCQSPFIKEAVVVGVLNEAGNDNEIAAILYPDAIYANEMLGGGYDPADLEAAIGEWVEEINLDREPYEQIRLYVLHDEPFPRNAAGRILRADFAATLRKWLRE